MDSLLRGKFRRSRRLPRERFRISCVEQLERRMLLSVSPGGLRGFESLVTDRTIFDDQSILVRFRNEAPGPAAANDFAWGTGMPLVPGLHEIRLGPGDRVEDVVAAYAANPSVLYAQPNYRVHIAAAPPNDSEFSLLWGLHNTGQTGGTPDADIDALEAWGMTTSAANVIVAVIDTGIDYTHPDLAGNMWVNDDPPDGIDNDGNGYVDDRHGYDFANNDSDPMDDHGHGTHVAGTIGALGNNGIGVAGVAWDVQLMAIKFLDAGGGGWLSDAILSINYAVANGASISNNSWGGGGFDQALMDAIQAARNQDHIFVAAAGNESSNNDAWPAFPATYNLDNIVSVAATDHHDQLAWFSNVGATTVDLGAPGVDIVSTLPGNTYGWFSGTSMATPHVTGVMALVRAQNPSWSYSEVIQHVLAAVDPIPALAGNTVTGGRLNAANALVPAGPDVTGPRVTASSPTGTITGSVDHVRVRFSESIDTASFDATDIASFTGPAGAIPVTGVSVVPGSLDREFDIQFAAQSSLGDYSLVLGPDIVDLVANAMDQDRDGVNGEANQDQYTATFTIRETLHYCSTDVPAPIRDWTITISYLTIPDSVVIGDLNVQLDVTHTRDSDLYIHLRSPSGMDVSLVEFRGGNGDHFTNTTFDDEATTAIGAGTAPFTGSFRPEAPLSQVDGENASGVWELWVEDWGFRQRGTLNAWCLTIQPGGVTPPPPPPPTNNPPDAQDDYDFVAYEDTPLRINVLANDFDPDGDPLSIVSVESVQNGSVTINADQTVTFTPTPDFNGFASFAYTIADPAGATDVAYVWFEVLPVNDRPVAVDDAALGLRDTPISFDWWPGNPPPVESNDYDIDGDFLTVVAVNKAVNGTAVLNWDGTVTFTPHAGFVGIASFEYTVSDGELTDVGYVEINVQNYFFLSTTTNGTLTNSDGSFLTFTDADILRLLVDVWGNFRYEMYFDGSDVGLTTSNEDIDAFTVLADGDILVSTVGGFSVPNGAGGTITGAGEDLLRFTPSSLGEGTSGVWSWYFDGSDVGLSGSNENLDAISVLPDGRLVVSTAGNVAVPGVSGADVDLLVFTPVSLGAATSGSWALYFDGSDVSLSDNTGEDIDAVHLGGIDSVTGLPQIHFSTRGNFNVPGATGANEDVVAFRPTSLGATTAGTYSGLTFDGSLYGLASFDIDGISLGISSSSGGPPGEGPLPPPPPPLPLGAAGSGGGRSSARQEATRPPTAAGNATSPMALLAQQSSGLNLDRAWAAYGSDFDASLQAFLNATLLNHLAEDIVRSRRR